MADDANRKEILISASKSGDFLNAAYQSYLAAPDEREDLPLEIATLHNDGHINVVAEFSKLEKKQEGGPDFFMTRRIFEKALPYINAPLKDVMHCVLHLHKAAGQLWYPDERSEDHFYKNSDAHGAVLANLALNTSVGEFLAQVFGECEETKHFEELSAVKYGWWPLIIVACRNYRLPLPLHFLIGLRDQDA